MVSSITPTVLAVERYHAIFSEAFQNSITAERRQHKAVHRLHLDSKWIYIFPDIYFQRLEQNHFRLCRFLDMNQATKVYVIICTLASDLDSNGCHVLFLWILDQRYFTLPTQFAPKQLGREVLRKRNLLSHSFGQLLHGFLLGMLQL